MFLSSEDHKQYRPLPILHMGFLRHTLFPTVQQSNMDQWLKQPLGVGQQGLTELKKLWQ